MTEIIERLSFRAGASHSATEAAIHLNRYLPVKRYCLGKRVLDVACGEGYGAYLLTERWGATRVDAVDVSPDAIAAAKQHFASPKVALHCAGAERLLELFAPQTFDVIASFETIEHVADAPAFLAALRKLLKPDGVLLVSCPNDHWYYPEPEQRNPFHQRKYLFAEFQSSAEAVLGPASDYLFGWPIGGFMNAGLQRPGTTAAGQTALAILDGTAVDAWSAAAEERLTPDKCSYFLGVWDGRSGAPRQETPSAVLHPVSMDTFAARWAVDAMRTEIQQVRTELWDAQHRGPVRVELTALAEAADAILNRAGLAGQAPRWPTDRETSDQEMFAFLRARLQLLRDAQLGNEQLKLELRNADLHRQAVEIENKVLRERLQQLALVGAIQVAGPVTLPQRSLAFARRQVARARNVAGAVLRRVRGR